MSMNETIQLVESFLKSRENFKENYNHSDWRVRYGLAVAIGEYANIEDIPILEKLLDLEAGRSLFNQLGAMYDNCTDDTRMSEYIAPLKVKFDKEYDEATLQAWQCRGRIYQAVYFAISKIGYMPDRMVERTLNIVKTSKEYAVVAAACIALRCVKDKNIAEQLKNIKGDDFCSEFELNKTIAILSK